MAIPAYIVDVLTDVPLWSPDDLLSSFSGVVDSDDTATESVVVIFPLPHGHAAVGSVFPTNGLGVVVVIGRHVGTPGDAEGGDTAALQQDTSRQI